jgi:hypothetical protein
MSKKHHPPTGLPAIAQEEPTDSRRQTAEEPPVIESVEEEKYQLEQETVDIMAVPPTCPRCGSTERTRLKEISPRIPTDRGLVIRYRTKCLGKVQPVDKDGIPVVDADGKPVFYECGNHYKVKKLVPKSCRSAS